MNGAIFINEVTINDPSSLLDVQVSMFKDIKSGGMFGVDSSFIEQNFDEDEPVIVIEPINGQKVMLDYAKMKTMRRKAFVAWLEPNDVIKDPLSLLDIKSDVVRGYESIQIKP